MKKAFLIVTLLLGSPAFAAVICRNGPVNSIAKSICVDEVHKYGNFNRIAEGYGAVGFNQYTKFCMPMTDGRICSCEYSFAGTPARGPAVDCQPADHWNNFASCVELMRDECKR